MGFPHLWNNLWKTRNKLNFYGGKIKILSDVVCENSLEKVPSFPLRKLLSNGLFRSKTGSFSTELSSRNAVERTDKKSTEFFLLPRTEGSDFNSGYPHFVHFFSRAFPAVFENLRTHNFLIL